MPPPSAALGATAFGAIIFGLSYVPVVRTICRITDRYLDSQADSVIRIPFIGLVRAREGTIGTWMIGILIAINLAQVALNVRLSFFSRDMFNALEAKDAAAFWYQLFVIFTPLAAVFVAIALTEVLLQNVLTIRWRAFLNTYYVGEWLGDGTHYRMQLLGRGADNPDQRISEDLRKFVESTYSLSVGLMNQAATLVSFVAILWTISAGFTFPGTNVEVPGLLVWVCAGYAILGTWVTHLIGRPLIGLNFEQERVEANYRFSLARLREYTEQVALLSGEPAEREGLARRFGQIVDNYMRIVVRLIKLNTFTSAYFQANVVVPYILTAPYYFVGKITLGQMQQVVGAFSRVESALTYFITIYTTLADYKAVLDRLTTFEGAIASAQRVGGESKLAITEAPGRELRLQESGRAPARRQRPAAHGRAHLPSRRAHADDRPVGLGQVHPVPRHRRHLALRRGRGSGAGGADHDAPAAAALHSHRHAARCRHLSGQGRRLQRRRRWPRRCGPPSCPRSRSASTRSGPGPRPCRSASSSASRWPARFWPSPTGCSWTRRPPPSTSRPRRRSTASSRRSCRRPPSSPSATARPWRPITTGAST